jgi:predicted solute-binding protein
MYVNDLTIDMGERGRAAVTHLLGREPEFAR